MNQKNAEVQIKPAKGRPMLTWVGKRPLRNVISYPAQLVEKYGNENKNTEYPPEIWQDWPADYPKGGLLFHGDNKEVLAYLLANGFRGKIKLIYIDPPFDSGADYVKKVELHGSTIIAKLQGESYNLGEQIQYTDIWANDSYLQFMYERLLLLKELLSENGSIWLHCDTKRSHVLRCLLDEVFGSDNFQNEIAWQRSAAHSDSTTFSNLHDVILFYAKGNDFTFNKLRKPYTVDYVTQRYKYVNDDGRKYMDDNLTATGLKGGGYAYEWKGILKSWRCPKTTMERYEQEGRLHYTSTGVPRLKRFLDEMKGLPLSDIWTDIFPVNSQAEEREDYPTQKPETLLERIIAASSNQGDIVLDCFMGSGTTVAVAQKMGRRWVGCDINKGAVQTTSKRLCDILQNQVKVTKAPKSPLLIAIDDEQEELPRPTQLSFTVFRVNDYDLQIQHNEAVNLACEHIGITRTKTDAFFDGVLGKRLVKIVPFNHPVSQLDMEEIKNELGNRPEEARDIVVVSLGKEMAVDVWIEEWNRLRRQGDFPNKMDVIELRSDPRYGGFFTHQPAQAQVKVQRTEKGIEVIIEAFISPTIIERMKKQAGLLSPQIEEWRAMVDSVMIDSDYDGKIFNVVLADVPEKKSDLVAGKYLLPAGEGPNIAVKITDMLGEELLIVQKV